MQMKKLLTVMFTVLLLTACSSDPVYHGLSQKEKETYAKHIEGDYPVKYTIFYTAGTQVQEGDGKMSCETVDDAIFSVSDLQMHTVVFSNFPLSLLARVVDDAELGKAIGGLPNMGLTGTYQFVRSTEHGMVDWYFEMNPVSATLTYGGREHHITMQFRNSQTFVSLSKGQTDGGTAFEQGRQLQLHLSAIYDGGQPLWESDGGWADDHEMFVVVRFGT